ncbi:MAG: hypothetical protein AABX29_00715 [Nanoarchaeota archaeon]
MRKGIYLGLTRRGFYSEENFTKFLESLLSEFIAEARDDATYAQWDKKAIYYLNSLNITLNYKTRFDIAGRISEIELYGNKTDVGRFEELVKKAEEEFKNQIVVKQVVSV